MPTLAKNGRLPWKKVHAVSAATTIASSAHASSAPRTSASAKRRRVGASSDGVRGSTTSEDIRGRASVALARAVPGAGGVGRLRELRVQGVLLDDRLRRQ